MPSKTKTGVMSPRNFKREVTVGEYTFTLPKPPNDVTQIMNWEMSRVEQKWHRPFDIPSDKEFDSWELKDQLQFLEREFDRRVNGFWFYNNGKLEYLTGHHYFFLVYWKLPEGYPYWKDTDRDFFHLYDYTENLDNCYGMLHLTNRRDGKTAKSMAVMFNTISINEESNGGVQSKTGKDAKEIFVKLVRCWQKLPDYMKPKDTGDTRPTKSLRFEEPSKRSTKDKKKVYKKALNSIIDYAPSNEEAYDGSKLKFYYSDEVGKTEEANIYERWLIVRECLTIGRKIIGKTLHTSTVEEMEKKGGYNCKLLWDDSDMSRALQDGRDMTHSGMLRYFKPAYKGLLGFIDEYGYSVVEDPEKPVEGLDGDTIEIGAITYLKNKRKGMTGSALASEKRKYPMDIHEAFYQDGKNSPFDVVKLNEQNEYNSTLLEGFIVQGDFVWKDRGNRIVEFRQNSNGKFKVVWQPKVEDRNKILRGVGKNKPGNCYDMSAGVDPFDHKTTADNRRSNAAAYVFRKFNALDPASSGLPVCQYLGRPSLPETFYEDMAKMCVYYGTEILVETNKIGMNRWFENNGFGMYLMDRPAMSHTEWSKRNQKEKGMPNASEAVRELMISVTQSYIYENVGYDVEAGFTGKLYFSELINSLINFTPDKWTEYDEFVGFAYALIGAQRYTPSSNFDLDNAPSVSNFVKLYRNK